MKNNGKCTWKKKVVDPLKNIFRHNIKKKPQPNIYGLIKEAIEFSKKHSGIPVTFTFGEASFTIDACTNVKEMTAEMLVVWVKHQQK
jgi:hypothetical protein